MTDREIMFWAIGHSRGDEGELADFLLRIKPIVSYTDKLVLGKCLKEINAILCSTYKEAIPNHD